MHFSAYFFKQSVLWHGARQTIRNDYITISKKYKMSQMNGDIDILYFKIIGGQIKAYEVIALFNFSIIMYLMSK